MKSKLMFENETHGMIEVFFTPEELAHAIEIMTFTKSFCEQLVKNPTGNLTEEMLNTFRNKQIIASILTEKLLLDGDPGRPNGPEGLN